MTSVTDSLESNGISHETFSASEVSCAGDVKELTVSITFLTSLCRPMKGTLTRYPYHQILHVYLKKMEEFYKPQKHWLLIRCGTELQGAF